MGPWSLARAKEHQDHGVCLRVYTDVDTRDNRNGRIGWSAVTRRAMHEDAPSDVRISSPPP